MKSFERDNSTCSVASLILSLTMSYFLFQTGKTGQDRDGAKLELDGAADGVDHPGGGRPHQLLFLGELSFILYQVTSPTK